MQILHTAHLNVHKEIFYSNQELLMSTFPVNVIISSTHVTLMFDPGEVILYEEIRH